MRRVPASPDDLIGLLRQRHRTMLARRADVQPGDFKQKVNRAGSTTFVPPEYVVGTLKMGHELHGHLEPGLARAIFTMFLVSEVHPFIDGNGRIARIMMNAELMARGQPTIIIPTVHREDYLLALRALTRRNRPRPLVDAMVRAAAFSNLDFSDYPRALAELQRRNWFREPDEAKVPFDEP
jgi:fido (protein-threonine AMPylation protein)